MVFTSSVSFSRFDDNDSAEREQSSSIRLLMRVIIEPGSPVLIMRFRICRSEKRTPTPLRRYCVIIMHVYMYLHACVFVRVRAHPHPRVRGARASASVRRLIIPVDRKLVCRSRIDNKNDDRYRDYPRKRNYYYFFFVLD